MPPKSPPENETPDMFSSRLENMIDMRHELVRLGELVDWRLFEAEFGPHYAETGGVSGEAGAADGRAAVPEAHARAVGRGSGVGVG